MTRYLIGASLLAAAACSGTALAGGNYVLNGKNTKVEFVGTKANGKHDGGFSNVTGTATMTGTDPTTLKLDVEIDTTSLYSDTPKLTQHLKSSDFFSVKTYPQAKFVSTGVARVGDGYTVTGALTLLGKTKTISFPARITAGADGLSLSSQFEINRQDFGMSYATGKVNDEVRIKVSVHATK